MYIYYTFNKMYFKNTPEQAGVKDIVVKKKRTDGEMKERGRKERERSKENENERERVSVCRLLQSHCTTLEFQTRTLGRAESRGESRGEERLRGGDSGVARERAAS